MEGIPISIEDVRAAQQVLKGVAKRTPVMTSSALDDELGFRVFFKCENFQRMGAFKFRGAYNACASLTEEQRNKGVVTHSSGNHAQAMALSASLFGIASVIVMPDDSPQAKIEATRAYQAKGKNPRSQVVLCARKDRENVAQRFVDEGWILIPPYNHAKVMAGQGTCALELIEEVGHLDELYVCVGGGGLISGCAVAAKSLLPSIRVIGVEPEAGNDAQQSFKLGEIVTIPVPNTIADGAQTTHLGDLTFAVIRHLVNEILTVPDSWLIGTMKLLASRMKIVVEPTGCLAASSVLFGASREHLKGKRIGVIISGGNVDLERYAALLSSKNATEFVFC